VYRPFSRQGLNSEFHLALVYRPFSFSHHLNHCSVYRSPRPDRLRLPPHRPLPCVPPHHSTPYMAASHHPQNPITSDTNEHWATTFGSEQQQRIHSSTMEQHSVAQEERNESEFNKTLLENGDRAWDRLLRNRPPYHAQTHSLANWRTCTGAETKEECLSVSPPPLPSTGKDVRTGRIWNQPAYMDMQGPQRRFKGMRDAKIIWIPLLFSMEEQH